MLFPNYYRSKPKIKRVLVEKVDDVIKPKFDEKSYRGLQLANGLKALLISDSKTDQAVITLTIGVGKFSFIFNLIIT